MQRPIISSEKEARKEIENNRTLANWLENQHALPFNPHSVLILKKIKIK